jgi:chromate transport protein ChrA
MNPMRLSHDALYATNLALLLTHQVDAAYQREWEMMGVPGGIAFFLAFNLAVSVPLILAFRSVVKNTKHARTVELILGGVGLITVGIHVVYFFLGRNEFTQISSLLILFAIFFMSVLQIISPSHQLDHPSKPEET